MKSLGFDYRPATYVDTDLLYGLLNPLNEPIWRKYGYAEPPAPEPPSVQTEDSEAFYTELQKHGGCADRGSRFVYSAPAAQRFADSQIGLVVMVDQLVIGYETVPDGAQKLTTWHLCMVDQGYDYATPGDARAEFSAPDMAPAELATREADFECDNKVGLTSGRSEWETNRIRAWLNDNSPIVIELEARLTSAEDELTAFTADLSTSQINALPAVDPSTDEVPASTLQP